MTDTLNDDEFHQQALAGGASRHSTTHEVPSRGYMVGGARNLGDMPIPEQQYSVDAFSVQHVRQHARAIKEHFGEEHLGTHQGAWREGDNVVLDASEQVDTYSDAATRAKTRGERAIYDVKRDKDINTKDVKVVN